MENLPLVLQIFNLIAWRFVNRSQNHKLQSCSGIWDQGINIMSLPSKDKGLRDIGYSMSLLLDTRKYIFWSLQWCWFHIWWLWHVITICNRYYHKMWHSYYYKKAAKSYYKIWQFFSTGSDSFVAKCNNCYKMCRFCNEMQQLLQNVLIMLQNVLLH